MMGYHLKSAVFKFFVSMLLVRPLAAEFIAECVPGGLAVDPACKETSTSSEHALLQKAVSFIKIGADEGVEGPNDPTNMVNGESGFEGGDIDEVVDTSCSATQVRRRRREQTMCACRRRNSGLRYDGRWICQDNIMVQEKPEFVNPVWAEEFADERGDGSLNGSKWILTYSGSGNGNDEEQWYTGDRRDNLYIEDGVLKIVGKKEDFDGKSYTSGKITSRGKGDWGPGHRLEIRARLPDGVGTWPAIWMMPTESNYGGWPDSGEIDIMECIGRSRGKIFGTIHTEAYNHMKGTHKGKSFYTDFTEWHTYALDWHDDKLLWYADGNLYNTFAPDTYTTSKWPFDTSFYIILNLAIGGTLGGDVRFADDQIMEIDYVRVYCLDGTTTCPNVPPKQSCCSKCSGEPFCSPKSGKCYGSKNKDYYESCEGATPVTSEDPTVVMSSPTSAPVPTCCRKCGDRPWCSPRSGSCYKAQHKSYYERCPADPTPAPPPVDPSTCNPNSVQRRRRDGNMCACRRRSSPVRGLTCSGDLMAQDESYVAASARSSIRFMSYNVMGWAGCNSRPDRGASMFEKIYKWDPAVLGAQEVETGDGRGWDACASKISAGANVSTGGGSQFFNPDAVEKHESKEREIFSGKGYWISMTRYQHKRTQSYFLFFNSHWKHGYGQEQAHEVAKFINEQRVHYNSEPTILVGDLNQFCRAYDLYAYRYLTGQEGSSPVIFEDVHPNDRGKSFGESGDCRVDFILASRGQWSVNSAEIDRDGMGQNGWASDHAALKAELTIKIQ